MVRLDTALSAELERALGARITGANPLSGGDINEAFAVTLGGGRRAFVKTHANAPPGMFQAEARGLAWLAAARAVRVPEVLAVGASFLALELVEPGPRQRDFDETLGRSLAALHGVSPGSFGLAQDNFIGNLPQVNTPRARWSDFYRELRLEPQLERATRAGRATVALRRGFERLFARLDELCAPDEPPARLHGDLWGGNLHVTSDGAPCLIDPAVYGGHREVDLAMMRLFGGFSARVFAAYEEAHPLALEHAERVELYQIYPLMVHVNLFGGGYAASVERILERYA